MERDASLKEVNERGGLHEGKTGCFSHFVSGALSQCRMFVVDLISSFVQILKVKVWLVSSVFTS